MYSWCWDFNSRTILGVLPTWAGFSSRWVSLYCNVYKLQAFRVSSAKWGPSKYIGKYLKSGIKGPVWINQWNRMMRCKRGALLFLLHCYGWSKLYCTLQAHSKSSLCFSWWDKFFSNDSSPSTWSPSWINLLKGQNSWWLK